MPRYFHPRQMKPLFIPHRNLHINVHSSFILNSLKLQKPTCLSTDEWLNKLWNLHTMENCLGVKRKGLPIHVTTQMNLTDITLSERSQIQETLCYYSIYMTPSQSVWAASQNTIDWVTYKQQKCIYVGGKSKIEGQADLASLFHSAVFLVHRQLSSQCVLTEQKKAQELSVIPCLRALIPFVMASSS